MLFRSYALAVCACVFFALDIHASAQIQVQSPGSTSSVPVYLEANVSSCNGHAITGLSYSVDSGPFYTMNASGQINAYDFSISPGSHTIRFKAWTGGPSPCQEVDVNTDVSNNITPATSPNLDDEQNAVPVSQQTSTPLEWWGVPDPATGCCIDGNGSTTTTYRVTNTSNPPGPNLDGQSRVYYVASQATKDPKGNYYDPGERYSIIFGENGENYTNFVYDAYINMKVPGNIFAIEMDSNQADASGNVYIFGLECVLGEGIWKYTLNNNGADQWQPSSIACNPQAWTANTWHHVQLYAYRIGSTVYYHSITFDGQTSFLGDAVGGNPFSKNWKPGVLLINFQLDAIGNNGSPTTMQVYADGLSLFYW